MTHRLLALLSLAAGLTACSEYDLFADKEQNPGVEPQIVVDPPQLVWDGVSFGDSETKTFTITNTGEEDLSVEGTLLEGAGTFTVNGSGFPAVLETDETMTVQVAFVPDESSEDSAIVQVLSSDPDEPQVPVELLGYAGDPSLEVTPGSWDYGNIPVSCDTSVWVTMTNVGSAMLEVTDIQQSGTDFALTNIPSLPLRLAPGEADDVLVVWSPQAEGTGAGEIVVTSNDPEGDRAAVQTGSAIPMAECLPVEEGGNGEYVLSFTAEYQYADVAFLLDTTGSMTGLADSMASDFSGIASALTGVIPDITFGVATYDDYAYPGMGSSGDGDRPFILRQQQTSSLTNVQTVLNSIPLHYGVDQPESTLEALFQAATGAGYDQNCNRRMDTSTDVAPFVASSGDAFGGAASGSYNSGVAGTGSLGGMGFREGTLPIVIYATDAPFRDPSGGDGGPNGCTDANMTSTINALNAVNARTIGVGVQLYGYNYFDINQFNRVASGTGSYGDMDGNGTTEEAVVVWSGSSSTFQSTIVNAVQGLVDGATFDEIRLDIYGDDTGIVQSVSPTAYYNVASGDVTDFTIDIQGEPVDGPGDSVTLLELVLVGVLPTGGELTLQRSELYVVVGG